MAKPDISDVGHFEKINDEVLFGLYKRAFQNPCLLDLG